MNLLLLHVVSNVEIHEGWLLTLNFFKMAKAVELLLGAVTDVGLFWLLTTNKRIFTFLIRICSAHPTDIHVHYLFDFIIQ
jgi:hypothetical protein